MGNRPEGRVPWIESSWLPNTAYHGVFSPGLVCGAMARAKKPGSWGKPAFLYMSCTASSGL